jgi:hypothetical protein
VWSWLARRAVVAWWVGLKLAFISFNHEVSFSL